MQAKTNKIKLFCGLIDIGAFKNNFCIETGICASHIMSEI